MMKITHLNHEQMRILLLDIKNQVVDNIKGDGALLHLP